MKRERIIGWVLSGLVLLFLAMDAGGKLIAPAMMIANSPPLGIPADTGLYQQLGLILAVCGILYAVPRTAVLGAILLTGYLGGAVAMQWRVGNPLFSHTLFGVYLGVIAWGGLWLRDPRVRALIPIAG
ncbi:DoxX family protein [Sphingomonas sp. R-74633]|uniref:DoxX family protein n=1 Tax=Sphingomonas sp. R-74633 TaxID=2751188 RepID=UPI001C552A3D|nr:DoxX family protein [Sphingomonas sp. R-74633]